MFRRITFFIAYIPMPNKLTRLYFRTLQDHFISDSYFRNRFKRHRISLMLKVCDGKSVYSIPNRYAVVIYFNLFKLLVLIDSRSIVKAQRFERFGFIGIRSFYDITVFDNKYIVVFYFDYHIPSCRIFFDNRIIRFNSLFKSFVFIRIFVYTYKNRNSHAREYRYNRYNDNNFKQSKTFLPTFHKYSPYIEKLTS